SAQRQALVDRHVPEKILAEVVDRHAIQVRAARVEQLHACERVDVRDGLEKACAVAVAELDLAPDRSEARCCWQRHAYRAEMQCRSTDGNWASRATLRQRFGRPAQVVTTLRLRSEVEASAQIRADCCNGRPGRGVAQTHGDAG